MKILLFISLLSVVLLVIESLYSAYKKDGIYTKKEALGNILNFIALSFISQKLIPVYLTFFLTWYAFASDSFSASYASSFVLAFICVDFAYYAFHRLIHKVKFFWDFHFVHHSDTKLNLTTAFRISFVEHVGILSFFGVVFLLGFDPHVVYSAIFLLGLYQFMCHSQYVKLPIFWSYIFVTPQSHRIHHDMRNSSQNSNFGGMLSIWDRLFGTYKQNVEDITIGVKGYHEDNPLKYQAEPFLERS